MEKLAPSLECAIEVKYFIESGVGLGRSLETYIKGSNSYFSKWLEIWLINKKRGLSNENHMLLLKSPYQKSLVFCFEQGIKGISILAQLELLQIEIEEACNTEVEQFISLLPFKMMIPVFIFQFPAYLILLLGPILTDLTRSLGL
jgi:hypothetical protein